VIDAEDQAKQRPVWVKQWSEGVDNASADVKALAPTGNSAAAAIRRLRKDRPDIHVRVLAESAVDAADWSRFVISQAK
jgi:hypothetical protein